MTEPVVTLRAVLDRTDAAVRAGEAAGPALYPTGFTPLDTYLGGGLRAGELTLLGRPQGLGKTTFALQVARNAAVSGSDVVYFSFEHDEVTLFARLVALEAGLRHAPVTLRDVRAALDATDASAAGLGGRLGPGGAEAVAAVAEYADRFLVHRSDGRLTTPEAIAQVAGAYTGDHRALVVVDYLQKVAVPGPTEDERSTLAVEALKDLALELDVPVLAIVAADKAGLAKAGRLRIFDLRGSSALAYEADVVLMVNDKYDVVARHHLVYDVANADRFRGWVVLTVEKNRSGLDRVDLEFRKAFEEGRFDTDGNAVAEQLVDERVYVE
ncbi:MAG TPA: DnaB-like helicase C-terminal domain-containing protein [Mycobacteriales bacterium]|jgi:replicative DNA helicase|nr:DnaB-like helicase C-terminal domain-containing protein [Mycobacteriales bacterium]